MNDAGAALQCYQCDSNEDGSCPSWQPLDHNINALIDCMSFEAAIPGTFCMKVTRESPGCMFKHTVVAYSFECFCSDNLSSFATPVMLGLSNVLLDYFMRLEL